MSIATDYTTLIRDQPLPIHQDYYQLRTEGVKLIRELAGQVWTDHNTHDPGITTLEVLCYALTDLGYRTEFPMKDLLAPSNPSEEISKKLGLYPAHQVLPNSALTVNDYRRLLLKVEGIRNAWLKPTEEDYFLPIFADRKENQLTFGRLEWTFSEGSLAGVTVLIGVLPVRTRNLSTRWTSLTIGSFSPLNSRTITSVEPPEFRGEIPMVTEEDSSDYLPVEQYIGPEGWHLFTNEAGIFSYSFNDENGQPLLLGEKYTSSNSRDIGIRSAKINLPNVVRWQRRKTFEEQFFLVLRASNHREIARTQEIGGIDELPQLLAKILQRTVGDSRHSLSVSSEKVAYEWQATISQGGRLTDRLQILFSEERKEVPTELVALLQNPNSELRKAIEERRKELLSEELCNVRPHGFYKVLLELDVDDELGTLNDRTLYYQIPSGKLRGATVVLDLPNLDRSLIESVQLPQITGKVQLQSDGSGRLTFTVEALSTQLGVTYLPIINIPNSVATFLNSSEDVDIILSPETEEQSVNEHPIGLYIKKQQKIDTLLNQAICVLHANRNLCEDFLPIEMVRAEQIAVCVDVEAQTDADLEVLQAKMYLAIENYLNPPIRYYTLQELLNEGYTADAIFDGPWFDPEFTCQDQLVFTKGGFVKEDELEASELRSEVYGSDLIRILTEFDEVITVKNLLLRRYDDQGNPSGEADSWTLSITPGKQAVLNPAYSKFLFFKNEIPYRAKATETLNTLEYLRAINQKAAYVDPIQELNVPKGNYRDLHEYFPVQHDFPQTYGVGEGRLPLNAPPKRLAQAKQLKAYLLVFEQILADYLAQLNHAKWLLSPEAIDHTYASTFLSEEVIRGLETDFEVEYYQREGGAPLSNDPPFHQKIYESDQEFADRRNRLLDHLLARFAEQFTDYTLLLFNIKGDRIRAGQQLIEDKISFLGEYPVLSRSRGQALNYRAESAINNSEGNEDQLWNTDNISGLERRVARLLGISNTKRRYLHCLSVITNMIQSEIVDGNWVITIRSGQDDLLFQSAETFLDQDQAEITIEQFSPYLRSSRAYRVDQNNGAYVLSFTTTDSQLTHSQSFENRFAAEEAIRAILRTYDFHLHNQEGCGAEDQEGMYLIEHLLLRPLFSDTDDTLMPVCLPEDYRPCGEEDPYSFRISVVLPYWPGRFDNTDFRRFFERTLRTEVPAHIHVRICWVSNEQIRQLGERYRAFLIEKSKPEPDRSAFQQALRELIAILGQLSTVYPEATLHDCEEDGDEAPVRLGNTRLGSF